MKRLFVPFLSVFFILPIAFPAFANNAVDLYDPAAPNPAAPLVAPPLGAPPPAAGALLYDNGPLVNSPGTGVGGADESILQTTMNTYGFGCQIFSDNWIADDFTVPIGKTWTVGSMTFYLYQTGSTTASTITGMTVRIYDISPNTPGATPIAERTAILGSAWSNIYRVSETNSGTDTNRPVMATVVDMENFALHSGTYWVAWQASGSLFSGPWQPPITINGQTTTGNGLQYTGTWAIVLDSGTQTPQGFPFRIHGATIAGLPSLDSWGMLLLLLFSALAGIYYLRRKRSAMS